MKKYIFIIVFLSAFTCLQSQHFRKLGQGMRTRTFFHQQGINYYLHEMDSNGYVYAVFYDTVTSSFNFGHEYSQVRLQIFDGLSWLFSKPVRLFNRHSIDAPRVLDITLHNNEIYLSGSFDSSENNMGAGILKFSNGLWQSCNVSLLQSDPGYFEVNKCYSFAGQICITGNFDSIPGTRVNGLLLHDGTSWKPIGTPGNYGFNNLSNTSNVFFQVVNDSLYAFNKNKIMPDSIEIGGVVRKKLAVFRTGQFMQLNSPARYISGLSSLDKKLVVIPSSFLVYIRSIMVLDNGSWVTFNLPDSFYATSVIGMLSQANTLHLAVQDGNAKQVDIYSFNGTSWLKRAPFKLADNYVALESCSMNNEMTLSGNFRYIRRNWYNDSFQAVAKIIFKPATVFSAGCFLDQNNDKVRQAGEPFMRNCKIYSTDNKYLGVSNGNGQVNLILPLNSTCTFAGKHELGFESSLTYTVASSADSVYHMDFPFIPAGQNDVSVELLCQTANKVKQGFITTYSIFLENYSALSQTVDIKVNFNPRCSNFIFKDFTPLSKTAKEMVIRTLIDGRSRKVFHFSCVYAVDSFTLGEYVLTSASIALDDALKVNNRDTLRQIVSAAFDPNIKVAVPDVLVNNEREVKFYIYFENLGNDTALNVTVIDTLGSLFDLSSGVFLSTGPRNGVLPGGENNVFIWSFTNINLPPKGTGFVSFKVKLLKQAKIGDTVYNKAHIFFDYQKPVITNKAKVVFARDQSVAPMPLANGFFIYPNPGNGIYHYENRNGLHGNLEVFAADGRKVHITPLGAEGEITLPDHLAKGVYMLRIAGYSMEIGKIILAD